jgi:hypothetical protein
LDDAKEFVEGKGLVPDERSLDFGEVKAEPETAPEPEATSETDSEESDAATESSDSDEVA